MKTINKVQTAAAGLAVLLALSACGGAATGTPASETKSKTTNTTDISEGVQPDAAAVALLPQSYKDKGELTVADGPALPADDLPRRGQHRPRSASTRTSPGSSRRSSA